MQLQLVTATVKLFLKKPTERPQQMIQLVLTYATQETDNPDLRDRAYVYWSVLYPVPLPDVLQQAHIPVSWGPARTHPHVLTTCLLPAAPATLLAHASHELCSFVILLHDTDQT